MATVTKSHPALDAYYAHLKENGMDYGSGDPRGRHKVVEVSGHAIWRFSDGWGEWYFITQNGRARWLAQKWADVYAYAVAAPLKATINKPWIKEHGWSDSVWETAMTHWLEETTKALTTGDMPAGSLTVEQTRPRRRYPWEKEADANRQFFRTTGEPVLKELSEADIRSINRDVEAINRNRETAEAKRSHAFKPAQWTFPNGHPRCALCGHEEYDGGCDGVDKEERPPPRLGPTMGKAAGAGLIVALVPPPSIARLLAVHDGEPVADLHMTLAFFGDVGDVAEDRLEALEREIKILAAARAPLAGVVSGYGRFSGTDSDGHQAFYASLDIPDLPRLREEVVRAGEKAGLEASMAHGFTPHITLAYVEPDVDDPPRRADRTIPVTFNSLNIWSGDARKRIPFGMRREVPRAETAGLAFLKQDTEKRYTLGVMYKGTVDEDDPETDAHDDYAPLDILQEAQWKYVRSGDRNIYLQHGLTEAGMQVIGEWVGVLTWPFEADVTLVVPGEGTRKVTLPEGTVLQEVIWNDIGWPMVKDGRIKGLSMGGRYRTEVVTEGVDVRGPGGKALGKATATPQQRAVLQRLTEDATRLEALMAAELESAYRELGVRAERAYFRARARGGKTAPGTEIAFVSQDDTVDTTLEELDVDGFNEMWLLPLLATHLRRTSGDTIDSINTALALGTSLPSATAEAIVANGPARLVLQDVTGQTRTALFRALADAEVLGESVPATARRIRGYVPSGRYAKPETRARVIARTETKFAQNVASVEGYRASGKVSGLTAFDNQLGYDDADCTDRDGRTFGFEDAGVETGREHPNGTLSWAPAEAA